VPFKAPHVRFVSFAVEILPTGITQVLIVETDLYLNPQHPSYDHSAVASLASAAQNYLKANVEGPTSIRLISTRSSEF